MNKKTIITILLALVALAGQGQEIKKAAKSLTPKQARNNTSASRSTITRGYEPID